MFNGRLLFARYILASSSRDLCGFGCSALDAGGHLTRHGTLFLDRSGSRGYVLADTRDRLLDLIQGADHVG
jgi:hypothetical protein